MIGDDRTDDQADDRTRAALRAVADVPAPPAVTTVEQVMRQGRRRAIVQRGATVAAVVAVVAAIGVGGVLLRSAAGGSGIGPADNPTTTPNAPTSTTVEPPSSVPTTQEPTGQGPASAPGAELLPGWSPVDFPMASSDPTGRCVSEPVDFPESDLGLPDREPVESTFRQTLADQTGTDPERTVIIWEPDHPRFADPVGQVEFEVPMAEGTGLVNLDLGRFGGDPAEVADAEVTYYESCLAPSRKTLDDGTVLQLYQPELYQETDNPLQHLRIYQPNGRLYVLTTVGRPPGGSADGESGGGAYTSVSGLLPLDDKQLAELGEAVAGLGT